MAVTIGWTLGGPASTPQPPSAAAPGGAGALGGPDRTGSGNGPESPVNDGGRPRPSSSAASATAVVPRATLAATTSPTGLPAVSIPTLPPLTDPPVPTPTDISEPPTPSPTESAVPSTDPSTGGIGAGLIP
ncbi:hypothetical protein AB0M20_00750 [Actinoplanes sp. NPDC051633]|uniref:hypothetical protein n=1 Tax=Actinoplanes sp. NPDC051633 TaxID=3155670 RepID=UPI00341BFAAA